MTVEGFQDLLPTTPRLLRGAITYAAGTTGAVGATTLFTVTGDVSILGIAAKCTTSLTSAGAPTWNLGVTGNTGMILNVAYPDVTTWDAGMWVDTTSGGYIAGGGEWLNKERAVANGWVASADIIQTINNVAAATITGGVVRWYVLWSPISSDGNISLHANLVAF